MSLGEFIELGLAALLFLIDLATLRWLADQELHHQPPKLVRDYLFYRQQALPKLLSL